MITKLTPEQEADLPIFRDKWLAHGISTREADFPRAEAVICNFYARLGKPKPMFLRFSSPAMCVLAVATIRTLNIGQLGGQLRGQLRDQLWGQLRDQLWGQLRDQLRGQLRDQLWGQLGDQLGGQLGGQLRDQLWGQLWGQLGDQLRGDPPFVSECLWGQHEAPWLAYYSFGAKIGVRYGEENLTLLQAWCALAESVCWWAPYEGICIISDRPRIVHFDTERRLHCADGPAVAFSDGWGIHAWHGTRVPAEWINDRANLRPEQVLGATNLEQRRAGIEMLGWDRILEMLPSRVIDADPDPQVGTLLEIDLPGLDKGPSIKAQFLRVRCGTGRQFAMGIDPAARAKTALDAQAWLQGLSAEDFRIPTVRT